MDTRKVTLIATIAAIALVAVGIGYAYTASTANTNNTVTAEYLTLYQGGDGAYTFTTAGHNTVKWNTVDGKNPGTTGDSNIGKTYFKLETPENPTPLTGYTVQQVGQDFIINAQATNTTVGDQTCAIAATGFSPGDGVVFLKVVCNGTTTWFKYDDGAFKVYVNDVTDLGGSTFTIAKNTGTAFHPATVSVYYGYAGSDGISIVHAKGTNPSAPTQPLSGASLTFSINPVVVPTP